MENEGVRFCCVGGVYFGGGVGWKRRRNWSGCNRLVYGGEGELNVCGYWWEGYLCGGGRGEDGMGYGGRLGEWKGSRLKVGGGWGDNVEKGDSDYVCDMRTGGEDIMKGASTYWENGLRDLRLIGGGRRGLEVGKDGGR
ncbi:hypothetical protein Tco_0891544 [Tanacetum coccineum]|uniref:Uncharacterized protein n=1 Tax=Tanacetum coccineum TaxID=301880 RepID=A0ABQ5C597_9ASTR